MLRSIKDFEGYQVRATDDAVGSIRDFYFDDEHWTVRYLVVDTGEYFSGRRVLVSPVSFRETDASTRQFHLALTRAKVKASPEIDLDKPVSRQHERDFFRYYGWPYYWGFGAEGIWGGTNSPAVLAGRTWSDLDLPADPGGDPHLRRRRARHHLERGLPSR